MINIVDIILEWYSYTKYIIGLFTTLIFTFTLFMAYIAEYQKQAAGAKYAKIKYWEWKTDKYEFFEKKFNLAVLRKNDVGISHADIDVATLLYPRDYYSTKYYISEERIIPFYKKKSENQLISKVRFWDYLGDPSPTSGYGSRRIFTEISRSFYSKHIQNESYFAHPIYYDSYCPIYYNIYAILIRERLRTYSFEDKDFFVRLKTRALPH